MSDLLLRSNMEYIFILSLIGLLGAPSSGQDTKECEIEPADVVFVLDSSYSIWPPDFYKEVTFMEKVIETFNVGPGRQDTRIAALTFGHRVWPKFYLNTYFDKTRMLRAAKAITYGEGQTTNTGDALAFVRNIMLERRAGARNNTTKIVVVVTDGMFTQEVAKTLQDEGVFLFAVSVGMRLDNRELAGIASDPDDQYYFSIDKYSEMSYIKRTMEQRICAQRSPENITDTTAEFKGTEEVLILDCDGKAADIYFVIDSSYSINSENFAKEMEFIHSVVDVLDIGPNKTRVGVMTFSDDVEFLIRLEHNLSKQELLMFSNNAKYVGGGTDTANALRRLREEGFYGNTVQERDIVARIAIILTDGLSVSPESTATEANMLRKVGVQIFSIGIGEGIDKKELIDIASKPTDKYVLHVDDFGALMNIRLKLAARSCTVEPTNGKPFAGDQAVCHPMKDTDLLFVYDALELGSWRSQAISQFVEKSLASFNLVTDRFRVGREIENCPRGNIPLGGAMHPSDFGAVHFSSFTDLLNKVHRMKFSRENGGRENTTKMVVLFVDSSQRMNYETFLAARNIKNSVDYFFLVSVGKGMYNRQFEELSGSGIK
ncbi:MATN1-like protein [Mya arenaria]|uniref:MATN1-like protein n=1 Tax=Mya arenaria TaxID=6604 RepID=A0ABY7ERQ0_MYAAR|nr:MATN1-like protein [Mya arenaria]